jgi:hypothetical protein
LATVTFRIIAVLSILCALASGCGDDASFADAAPAFDAASIDASVDAGPPDAAPAPDADLPDAPPPAVVRVDCPKEGRSSAVVSVEQWKGGNYQYVINYNVDRDLRPGDTIEFVMNDIHDAVSGTLTAPDGRFRAEPLMSTCFRFDVAGEYQFFCTFHPKMLGVVHILTPL